MQSTLLPVSLSSADIYPARETNDEYNIYAEDVVKRLPNAEYMHDFNEVADRVKELARPGDLFITLGCGDIYKAAELIAEKYGDDSLTIKKTEERKK